jgi:hypothetical protein
MGGNIEHVELKDLLPYGIYINENGPYVGGE